MFVSNRNGNLLCAVCIDTTGQYPDEHDMLEICVCPLDRTFERDRNYKPFIATLKPIWNMPDNKNAVHNHEAYQRPHTLVAKGPTYHHAMTYGAEYGETADAFEAWFHKLGLKPQKRIMPLAYDWPFTGGFIRKWLGKQDFDDMFDYRHRDILSIALAENDNAEYNLLDIPFPKLDFSYLGSKLGMPNGQLQLPVGERALALGKMYVSYHLQRNTFR